MSTGFNSRAFAKYHRRRIFPAAASAATAAIARVVIVLQAPHRLLTVSTYHHGPLRLCYPTRSEATIGYMLRIQVRRAFLVPEKESGGGHVCDISEATSHSTTLLFRGNLQL